MDDKHIVSVPHHDEFLVDRVDDGLDEEIDEMAPDFAMRLKEGTLAALDRTTREVKRLSESVPNVNDWQTCFESVVLSAMVGMYGVLCHLDSSNDITRHDDGWWLWSALSSGYIKMVPLDLMSDIYIYILHVALYRLKNSVATQ